MADMSDFDTTYGLRHYGIMMLGERLSPLVCHDLRVTGQKLRNADYARVHETESGWRINITPSRVDRAKAWNSLATATGVVERVAHIADDFLGRGWGINQYIWDYSGVTAEPLFPLHVDDFDNCRALKVYVYLEACDADQAPLIYDGTTVPGKMGTVLLFDPSREHGSQNVRRGVRYIYRAHFVERKYVLRHLPEQLPWYLKPVSRVMRAVHTKRRSE
jgi:hypothetical protein